MTDASLPIIDLTPVRAGEPGALEKAAAKLGHAAREIGFFYVAGHGIGPKTIDAVFEASHALFALPLEDKMVLTEGFYASNRGYVPMKGESLDPSKPADLKEAFNIGLDLAADDPRILAGEPFRAVNQWPQIAGWRETVRGYFDVVCDLGHLLHEVIATDLGLEKDFFANKFDAPMATLRLLHYPPHPDGAETGQIGAGIHTDYGNLTILLPDDVGGLEVQRRDGTWISAPTIPGAYVCNIGDCLMRWTNDVYISTPHRVVNRGGRERYSIAFFFDPNPDAMVACLPTCIKDGAAKYPPVTAAGHLKSKLDASYAAAKKAANG